MADHPLARYDLVAAAAGPVLASLGLTVRVGRSLWKSHRAWGPAQDTIERCRSVTLFAGLAAVSLLCALYASGNRAVLSYRAWAYERGHPASRRCLLPLCRCGARSASSEMAGSMDTTAFIPRGENATNNYVLQWLSHAPLYLEAVEVLAERARRFWWASRSTWA